MRKLVTYVVVVATIVWSLGLAAVVPASAAYTPVAGDLIKTSTDSAVYYIDAGGKRNLFVNGVTFWTWYSGSWSALKMGNKTPVVKILSQGDFDALTNGTHVAVRAGVKLIKFQNSPKVYVVSTGNVLREVSDTLAKSLFGADYATKKLITIQNGFEGDYTKGAALASGDKLPDGSLIKYSGSEDIFYIQDGLKRMVTSDAFIANGFWASSVVTVPATMVYTAGTSITGEEAALTTIVGTVVPPGPTAGSVTVALASDTPAAGLALTSAQRVGFTKVNFTASNDGDAIIDSMVVQRTGIGADTDFSTLILMDASGNVIGNSQTLNSVHQVTFSTDLTIPKGTTKSYTLAANMATTGLGGGNLPSLSLVSVAAKGSTTVVGTLPIVGNVMTINSALTIGTVTVTQVGASYNPTNATKQVGTENYIFASLKATANSTEDIQIESIRWYQASTTADTDITGLELLQDGVTVVGTGSLVDREVIFTFATPVKILKGNTKEFSIRGDIVNGSGRVASFGPSKITDWKVKGLTYSAYLNPTYDATTEPNLVPDQTETTIGSGSITFSKAVINSTNVAPSVANQELSAFYAQVIGEPIVMTRIVVDVATSSSKITNVKIVDENGNTVAGPTDPGAGGGYATSTDTITFPVGTHKYTIKGDLVSAAQWAASASLAIRLDGAHLTAKGQTTNLTITPSPSTFLSLDTLTVRTASLTVGTSASPAAQSVVKGTSNYVFANFTLSTSGSGEDIKVTQLTIKHTTTAEGNFDDIQNITLYDGTTALNTPVQGTSETADSAFGSTATTTITLLTALVIPKDTVKTLTLKGDISGSAAAVGHAFGIVRAGNVVAQGSGTGTTVTPTVTVSDGQLQTVNSSGTLRYYAAGNNPGNQIVVGNTTGNIVGQITLDPLYESIEITSIGMTFNDAAGANDVSSIDITDGTNTWNVPVSGQYATVSPVAGSLIVVPVSSGGALKTLTVKANTSRSGLNQAAVSGDSFTITFTNIVAKGKSSGITGGDGGDMTITGQTTATNSNYIYASKPTVGNFTSALGTGNGRTLFQFTVSADAKGDVGFYKVTFDITTGANSGVTTTNLRFIENPGSSEVDLSYRETNYALPDFDSRPELIVAGEGGTLRYNIIFNTQAYTASPSWEYRTVGAGQSKTFALRGDVGKSTTGSFNYSIALIGDGAAAAMGDATTTDALANDSFIWSDLNYGNNTGTATATNEWTNGYLLFTTSTQSASF
ncbi:MAG: hypothetical protein Q7K65_03965 [Candidatus Buchananbacteria bacterium]|nr:hypothetical protein [Candidatus Buchananbacteria bacterium]